MDQTRTARGQTNGSRTVNLWFTFLAASTLLSGYAAHSYLELLNLNYYPYRVLGSFHASGWAASHGLNPYGIYPLTWRFHPDVFQQLPLFYDVNLSPPCMLPLFSLLARFPIRGEIAWWTAISVVLFIVTAGTIVVAMKQEVQKRHVLWLLLSATVLDTLKMGQDYALLFLLVTLIWLLTARGNGSVAAILIGIVIAMKPNLGLWPILMFVAGRRRPAAISSITAVALSAYPVFVYGPSIYSEWLRAGAIGPHWIYTTDISFPGIFARLGARPVGIAVAVLCAVALVYFVRRIRPSELHVAGIAICAGIMCSPLAWYLYVIFAAPFFVALGRWGRLETAAAIMLSYPPWFEGLVLGKGKLLLFFFGLPHYIGLWLMLTIFLRAALRSRASVAHDWLADWPTQRTLDLESVA
jgi:alpha-1,2-mannosyltransferase